LETSAKNATNVEQAFLTMAKQIKDRYVLFLLLAFIYAWYLNKADINVFSTGTTTAAGAGAKTQTVKPGASVQAATSGGCC
jgi:hypothetical protein